MTVTGSRPSRALSAAFEGEIHLPGRPGHDDARRGWNLRVDQDRPGRLPPPPCEAPPGPDDLFQPSLHLPPA